MYEREENAQFSLISYSKERRFRVFQTLPDSWKNKKLLQVLTWFLKLVYYRDYLSKIWRNSKIHDCQPILENYRHWLLKSENHLKNYGDQGGCYPLRLKVSGSKQMLLFVCLFVFLRITHSKISIIVQMIRNPSQ